MAALEEMVLWAGSERLMVHEWPTAYLGTVHRLRGNLERAEEAVAVAQSVR